MAIKAKTFTASGGGAGTDNLDDVTSRGATTTNAITVGGLSVGSAYTMPTADGTTGTFLKTDGAGSISFGSVTGSLSYKGSYDASTSTPSLTTALKGDFYIISVAGTLAGVSLSVGDHIVFNQNASSPITSAMFDKIDNTEADTLATVVARGASTPSLIAVGGLTVNSQYTMPTTDGNAGEFLKTNGTGGVTFGTALTELLDDPTPELASDLDTVGNGITSSVGGFSLTTSGGSAVTIGTDFEPTVTATHSLGSEDKRFITTFSDLNGAVRFKAKNDSGGVINKGQAIFISGVSGDVPTVQLARANSASTMPAFGLAATSANDQAEVQVVSFGNLTSYNTTTYSLSLGDTVYVSSATAGALTNSAPSGESNLIQNVGKVVRASATEGIIKVGGAGRSAATPNLDQNKIFLGDASNQAVSTALSSINLSSLNNDLSFQPLDAGLTSISGLTTSADKLIYTTASDTYATSDLTSAGRALLDDADASAQRTTLGLGSAATSDSSDFLASTAGLNDLSDVSFTAGAGIDNYVLTYDNSTSSWGAEAGSVVNDASETQKGIIEIATNAEATSASANDKALVPSNISSIALSSFNDDLSYQPLDAGLTSIAGLTTSADKLIYTTASDTYATSDLTSAGRALLDDADASAQRTTLGLGSAATSDSSDFLASTAGLNDLSDVSFTAGAGIDNYVLTYDNSTSSWGAEASGAVPDASETQKGIIEIATNAEATSASATDKALVPSNIGSIALSSFNNDLSFLSNISEDASPQLGGDLDLNGNDIVTVSNADLELAPDGTGTVVLKGNQTGGNNQGSIKFNCEQNSHGVTIQGPAHSATATYTLTLPTSTGTANQVLKTDGTGVLNWTDQASSAPTLTTATPSTDYTISTYTGIEEIYKLTPSASISVFLPSAATTGSGYKYNIKNMSTYTITVDPDGFETIDGSTTYDLNVQYQNLTLCSDGTNWIIL